MAKDRAFQDFVTDLDDGEVHRELTQELKRVAKAVRETNKAGSLTFTVNLSQDRARTMNVKSSIRTKIPTRATNPTQFYDDDEGTLHRDDPKQIPLKNINMPTPIKGGGGGAS